jgi:hypothetical protein
VPHRHTQMKRRARFRTAWSKLNAELGGVAWREHPNLMLNVRYDVRAPYAAPTHQWAKFIAYYKRLYAGVWDNGGSSWKP